LRKLPLQVQAARKLDGVAHALRMPQEQGPPIRGDVRNHLHNRESRHVAPERRQHPVTLLNRERLLSSTTDDARRNVHLGKPATASHLKPGWRRLRDLTAQSTPLADSDRPGHVTSKVEAYGRHRARSRVCGLTCANFLA